MLKQSQPFRSGRSPEEHVLRGLGLSPAQCAHIGLRAAALRVGLESVAFNWGLIDENGFYAALARDLGIGFVNAPFAVDRACLSLHSVEAGIVRKSDDRIIAAPRGEALRLFLRDRPENCQLTTPTILRASLRAAFIRDQALNAAGALPVLAPHETAHRDGHASGFVVAAWFTALTLLVFCEPLMAWPITVPMGLLYAWTVGQRIASIMARHQRSNIEIQSLTPADLPIYSVLVPLYREDQILKQLIVALEALDYPPEKLEILFLVEEDDAITLHAFSSIKLPPFMRLIVCAQGIPRTKPRALNIGLRECTGEFIAIFDAEDRPEPDQLVKAAAQFRASDDDVACLQAEIVIENGDVNFWTRCFALEYAALFQIIVPGLCRFHLPVALGGTSNHFRRQVLLALNGWDAWNVTEDADLGLRLAMHGYRIAYLPSRTWEEAPMEFATWRKQRTRWIKGWMQTSHVHLPQMVRGLVRLPISQTIGCLHHLIGTPVSALLTPLFSIALVAGWLRGDKTLLETGFMAYGSVIGLAALMMMAGLYRHAQPQLSRRGRFLAMMEMPLYLLFICSCAWMALAELVNAPFRWNKTPHGQSLPQTTGLRAPSRAWLKKFNPRADKFCHKSLPVSRHAQAPPRPQAPPRL